MKIALVGPGLLPIPPSGWGAIESLIWKYSELLLQEGHEVKIFNSQNLTAVVDEINQTNFDFIHVHYDEFIHYFLRHCKKTFCITSHYGYILKKSRWSKGYFSVFADFLEAPGIIALSSDIQNLYLTAGYEGASYILKNGIDKNLFSYKAKGNGRVICLGKIEPRKQQAILSKLLEGEIEIDFVGPISDELFTTGITSQYKGVWSREEVQKRLTEYSTLILLSDGEAAPLVVVEALMAGVSVVISKASAANLADQPFITILEDDETHVDTLVKSLRLSIENNFHYREQIRSYAISQFDTQIILEDYQKIIEDFIAHYDKVSAKPSLRKKFFFSYYFSRGWLLLSKINFLRRLKSLL